jgi:hypothetical protein
VDGDHEARQHVEIDIGLVAGLLEQQPQQLGELVAQLLVVLCENLRGIRVADRVQRVLGRDEIPTGRGRSARPTARGAKTRVLGIQRVADDLAEALHEVLAMAVE